MLIYNSTLRQALVTRMLIIVCGNQLLTTKGKYLQMRVHLPSKQVVNTEPGKEYVL